MSELVVLKKLPKPAVIYTSGAAKEFVNKVKDEARAKVATLDISTEKGRKEIASLAYSIANAKTTLDAMGKTIIEEAQATVNAVNKERKFIRDDMDALKKEIRAPLTAYEDAEKQRIADHENNISSLAVLANVPDDFTAGDIAERITRLKECVFEWEEFEKRGSDTKKTTLDQLHLKLSARQKYEEEQRELIRLRAEQEARQKAESERLENERIEREKKAAVDKARLEAEEKAKLERVAVEQKAEAERKRLEKDRQDAINAVEKAKADAKAAKEKADRDMIEQREKGEREAAEAVKRELGKIAEELRLKEHQESLRNSDKANRAKIHNEIKIAIMVLLSEGHEDESKAITIAIAKGEIPHIKILY